MKALAALSITLALSVSAQAASKELEGVRAPANTVCPSPEEAQKKMTVPEGYAVRFWAHEPMVQNPVAMAWDARGRLWVVEAYEYPEGTPLPVERRPFGKEAKDDRYQPVPKLEALHPKDRVIILEDTDNDGEADKRTVFVEGLDLASAIICGDDGIYVGQQPHLLHFKDSNHDDKPDEWRVVLTGFGREDTHELVNSFCWGPDGWLYMTHGVFTNSKVRRPGVPEKEGFKFDAGIGRCRPMVGQVSNLSSSAAGILPADSAGKMPATLETGGTPVPHWEFEVFADGTSNPWGCDYDERGNFFVSACVIDHFFHMAPGGIYVRQGGAPENPYAYEQLPSIVKHKHFRAAYAGIQIYQGGVYPKDTWGHAFIGNIHDNAIHEEVLTPVGATFKCEPRRDFLRANDGWFRPVSTRTGPDGNLWIMDWCDKYPCYQNAKANPEGVDRERGRIWRVVTTKGNDGRGASWSAAASAPLSSKPQTSEPAKGTVTKPSQEPRKSGAEAHALQDASRPTKDMDLSKLDTAALVKLLGDSNNWMRRWARRELVEKNDGSARALLAPLVVDQQRAPSERLEVLWTMFSRSQCSSGLSITSETELILNPTVYNKTDGNGVGTTLPIYESALFKDVVPDLRAWSARFYGEFPQQMAGLGGGGVILNEDFKALASDHDPSVRDAVAIALRRIDGVSLTTDARRINAYGGRQPDICMAIIGLIESSAPENDAMLSFHIWQAIEPLFNIPEKIKDQDRLQLAFGVLNSLQSKAAQSKPLSVVIIQRAFRRIADAGLLSSESSSERLLTVLSQLAQTDAELLAAALDGLVKGQESGIIKPPKDFSALFEEFTKSDNVVVRKHAQNLLVFWGDPTAIKRLAAFALDAKASAAERIATVQTLRKVKSDAASTALAKLLGAPESQPSALIIEVIRAAADAGGDAFIAPLTKLAASKDPALQLAAFGALSNREAWTHAMLDAIAAKTISDVGFPASVRRSLATSSNKATRDHAFKVLGAWKDSSDDVKALIAAKKKACLEGEPDLAMGKLLFQTTCMVCHAFHGGGQKVGPELIGSGRSNLDALLANVIDPNQIIGNGYENFIVSTKDNRTLAGRITEDTPSHVKLLAIGGAETVVPRDQIAKSKNTHQSLMPMGFGGLPDDAFRSLIWYVLAPPEEGPLTADKKKQLSTSIDAPVKKVDKNHAIDWESVSLWNPQWKVAAPEFDRTPIKLAEYHGRANVLLLHPFEDKKTPASLERKWTVDAAKHTLKFSVAADDRGDWELRVLVNGKQVKQQPINHESPRWHDFSIDVGEHTGKEVTVRLEGHATGWAWEFGYWQGVRLE